MLFHYLSFDKHFSFSQIRMHIETYNQKLYIAYKLEFGILQENSEHMSTTHFLMESIKNFCSKTFCVGCLHKEYFSPFVIHYLHVKKCVLLRYFSMSLIVIDAKKLKWKHSGKCRKHGLKISPRFIALGESFAVEFIKICHYKTFWTRIFVREMFLLFRCCSIHVKLCVLVKYSARN